MKKIFKNWNLYEILFTIISAIAIVVAFVFTAEKQWLTLIIAGLGLVSAILTSKGMFYTPIINVIYVVFYVIVSINNKYYGEAIVYGAIIAPIQIFTIFSWIKNKQKSQTVEINKIHKKEWIYISIVTLASTVGLYFLLFALNTSELVVSTFSLVFCALANYLLLRRSSYYALAFVINDIFLVTLWLIAAIESNFSLVLMLINSLVFSVNDVYGFFRWRKQEKQQPKQDNQNEQQVLQPDENQVAEKTEQNI